MSKKLILYHSSYSPFSRSVLLLCRYLQLDVDVIELDLMNGEQMSEEFLALNPQHTVPTIVDDGFCLWESRAILTYLMESRAPHLLATSPKEKAIINQRLQFEQGKLAKAYADIWSPLFRNETKIDENAIAELYEILATIEEFYFPSGNEWIAGEALSAADFAYVSTIAGLVAAGASLEKYPRIEAWFSKIKSTFPNFAESIETGAQMFADWVKETATNGF